MDKAHPMATDKENPQKVKGIENLTMYIPLRLHGIPLCYFVVSLFGIQY